MLSLKYRVRARLTAIPALCFALPLSTAQAATAGVDYERQVQPVFAEKCLGCHNQEKRSGGLALVTYADALNGGRGGATIRPGSSAQSLIIQRITGEIQPRMPLGGAPLSADQIATIRAWIDGGARQTPTSPPAKAKWEAPLALEKPVVPQSPWPEWSTPVDRFVASYLAKNGIAEPKLISDAQFARRAYLDIWGLLPPPDALQAFTQDKSPGKRQKLVEQLLADNTKYAEHWISFWNDLLRNDEGVNYYSETASRKSITDWLLASLHSNLPYDQFVGKLMNPTAPADPDGFLIGVNWRGAVSASQTPAMQAAQNTAQIFLGINLKCNSCHDSFISKWRLKDAYSLASYFSEEEKLQLYRCDVAQGRYATPAFLYPELNRPLPSNSMAHRRATAAAIFTDPRNGRLPRTLVNRFWERLTGRGLVENVDEMDGEPWNPELLDWLASDFADHGYDMKRLLATIVSSRTYQLPAVNHNGQQSSKQYVFLGPEIRRLTAEQFSDAIAAITGDWHVSPPAGNSSSGSSNGVITAGNYSREWRIAANSLTRALGRPMRDQVFSARDNGATTIQAVELVNGETLTHWLSRGARRMTGELPPEPQSLYSREVIAGSSPNSAPPPAFTVDVSRAKKLYLIVQDVFSTAPDKAAPLWAQPEFEGPTGKTPLSVLKPVDVAGLRNGSNSSGALPVKLSSVLVYDIAGKGFTRFRSGPGFESMQLAQGERVQARFFVFDEQPDMDRLVPPHPTTPLPAGPTFKTVGETEEWIFRYALGRPPSPGEKRIADAVLCRPGRPEAPSAQGLSDLLWAMIMKPEFQLIY
jgi:mono/diheme cytochrome c family protein